MKTTPPQPAVHGVLFDLDDTLYDRQATFRAWTQTFIAERLQISDPAEREELLTWIESVDANGYGSKHDVMRGFKSRFPDVAGTVNDFYDDFIQRVALDDSAADLLNVLDAKAVPYGIVTNGSMRQWSKIRRMGLEMRTSAIFVSEEFGAKKPHPSIFLAAAAAIGVEPRDILFVGDNPGYDIVGSQEVGMQTAWLPRGRTWPDAIKARPDITITDLREIIALI